MSNRLGGKQGTAYTGTNANQPPNVTYNNRPPTQFDTQNVSVNDFWVDQSATGIHRIWVLVSLQGDMNSKGSLAQWVQFGTGTVESLTGNSGGPVFPDPSNNINVVGDGTGITIIGNPGTNTLTASLVGGGVSAQSFPTDSGTATPNASGVLNINAGNSTKHAGSSVSFSGSSNTVTFNVTDTNTSTFIGFNAGNLSASGQFNNGLGAGVLAALTTGSNNNCWGNACGNHITSGSDNFIGGSSSGSSLTTGSSSVLIGDSCANLLVSGSNHVILGRTAGAAYTTSESNNVIIGRNVGVVGESNTIRIGSDGSTTPNQTQCFINGISGITPSGTVKSVVINASGQLGTSSAAGIPAIEFIQTQTASNSASLNFTTGLTFTKYMVIFRNIVPATNTAIFEMLESTNGGSTWLATGYTSWIYELTISTGTTIGTAQPTTFFQLSGNVGSSSGQSVSGTIYLMLPSGTNSVGWGDGYFFNTFPMTPSWSIQKFGYVGNTTVNAIQFLFSTGNIASGVISLYGIVE